MAERLPGGGEAGQSRCKPEVRTPRRGGDAYAREWVKVLEETGPGRDPNSTYTWELEPEATGQMRPPKSKRPPASRHPAKERPKPAVDPYDTYTFDLQEGDSPDDPWGLNKDQPPATSTRKDGVNPYDTGVFDTTWTGRFDQR
jgi:hypothetical protein